MDEPTPERRPGQHWLDLAQHLAVHGGPLGQAATMLGEGLQSRAEAGQDLSGYDEHQFIVDVSTLAKALPTPAEVKPKQPATAKAKK